MNAGVAGQGRGQCLGAKPFVEDKRDLRLKAYVDVQKIADGPGIPAAWDWTYYRLPSGLLVPKDTDPLGNNWAGDCVYAAPGHQTKRIGAIVGVQFDVTEASVIDAYAKGTGFDPATGANDNGAYVRDMLKTWKSRGLYGGRILAFARVNWLDPIERAIANWLGCGTIDAYQLPLTTIGQEDERGRQLWDRPADGYPKGKGPGSRGGHCIAKHATSPKLDGGNSWGEGTVWTPQFSDDTCQESWLAIHEAWHFPNGRAPNGFAFEQLLLDAATRARM